MKEKSFKLSNMETFITITLLLYYIFCYCFITSYLQSDNDNVRVVLLKALFAILLAPIITPAMLGAFLGAKLRRFIHL